MAVFRLFLLFIHILSYPYLKFLVRFYLMDTCSGFLPTQISFPTFAAMVLGCQVQIRSSVLLESLFDYVSDVDRSVLVSAVQFSRDHPRQHFPPQLYNSFLNILSRFQCRKVPEPSEIRQVLVNIARFIFLTNPMSAISAINSLFLKLMSHFGHQSHLLICTNCTRH